MAKVVLDMSMSVDGFVAGPQDDAGHPFGLRGAERLHHWLFNGPPGKHGEFRAKGENILVLDEMYETAGAVLSGRRTYDFVHGWGGTHPLEVPVIVLTHQAPTNAPKGKSPFTFVTDGIESAVEKAKAAAGKKQVLLLGASPCQQALEAGLVDEVYVHVAPLLLGDGVRLFDHLGSDAIALESIGVLHTPEAVHVRYRVVRSAAA